MPHVELSRHLLCTVHYIIQSQSHGMLTECLYVGWFSGGGYAVVD